MSTKLAPMNLLKITTWNVASLRAAWRHGLELYVRRSDPDIFCIQETKMSPDAKPPITEMKLAGYHGYFLHAKKKGYSGTAIFTKIRPISVTRSPAISDENGRVITAEFSKFFLVNTYVMNAGSNLENLDNKVNTFLPELKAHLYSLRQVKPVIWTGDLNVAHRRIDIWMTDGFERVAGFTEPERNWFDAILKDGFRDVFRKLHPERQQFTFFDFRGNDRAKNRGWRIDYFVITESLMDTKDLVSDCSIDTSTDFSDHCPVTLLLNRDLILAPEDVTVTHTAVEAIPN
jgi:exodeoxyribonuclease-3